MGWQLYKMLILLNREEMYSRDWIKSSFCKARISRAPLIAGAPKKRQPPKPPAEDRDPAAGVAGAGPERCYT